VVLVLGVHMHHARNFDDIDAMSEDCHGGNCARGSVVVQGDGELME
jgi:hypothetical protein